MARFDPDAAAPAGSGIFGLPHSRERAGVVLDWLERGELRLHVDRELPLTEAGRAHEALEGRETTGKVLLLP